MRSPFIKEAFSLPAPWRTGQRKIRHPLLLSAHWYQDWHRQVLHLLPHFFALSFVSCPFAGFLLLSLFLYNDFPCNLISFTGRFLDLVNTVIGSGPVRIQTIFPPYLQITQKKSFHRLLL